MAVAEKDIRVGDGRVPLCPRETRGRKKFEKALARIPDVEPEEDDRL